MKYMKLENEQVTKEAIDCLKKIIKNGGIAIVPTDTVYGLVADAMNSEAVKKIYDLKQRKLTNPMCILVSNKQMIEKVTKQVSEIEEKIIEAFFPGALTMIFQKNDTISSLVTAGLETIRSQNAKR